ADSGRTGGAVEAVGGGGTVARGRTLGGTDGGGRHAAARAAQDVLGAVELRTQARRQVASALRGLLGGTRPRRDYCRPKLREEIAATNARSRPLLCGGPGLREVSTVPGHCRCPIV